MNPPRRYYYWMCPQHGYTVTSTLIGEVRAKRLEHLKQHQDREAISAVDTGKGVALRSIMEYNESTKQIAEER